MKFTSVFQKCAIKGFVACFVFLCAGSMNTLAQEEGSEAQARRNYKAKDMLEKGLEFIEMEQDERGVKILSSVPRKFPNSKVRFKAYLELGKYYKEKRKFSLAIKQFQQINVPKDAQLQAEAYYQTGVCYFETSNFDQAFNVLRKVTNQYPGTSYANMAYYYIGRCHFKLKRWSQAVEALKKVGTSVKPNKDQMVYSEIGKRFYVRVNDKDLVVLKGEGEGVEVSVKAKSGDQEKVTLEQSESEAAFFLGSIPTTLGKAKPDDGELQVIGGDVVTVKANDKNTAEGKRNQPVVGKAKMVSTASAGFTDGAYKEYTNGVFGDSQCFVRVKDMDRDRSDKKETLKCDVQALYEEKKEESEEAASLSTEEDTEFKTRDSLTMTLQETEAHSGIFVGSVPTEVVVDEAKVDSADQKITVLSDDAKMAMEYEDELHCKSRDTRIVEDEAKLLIGDVQDVKITHRKVNDAEVKAEKNLIEAKIQRKLGNIFKKVGLNPNAYEKADEGLKHVNNIIELSNETSLKRSLVEEAFSVKWELLLIKDQLGKAIRVCRKLMQMFPDSTLIDQALMKIGEAKLQQEEPDYQGAISIFNSVKNLENTNLRAQAAFKIAKAYETQARQRAKRGRNRDPDLSQAMQAYKQCAENYPESSYAGDSLDKIISYYINNKEYQRGLELIRRVAQDYPDASFRDKLLLKWAIVLYRKQDFESAVSKLDQLLREYPNSSLASKAAKIRKKLQQRL